MQMRKLRAGEINNQKQNFREAERKSRHFDSRVYLFNHAVLPEGKQWGKATSKISTPHIGACHSSVVPAWALQKQLLRWSLGCLLGINFCESLGKGTELGRKRYKFDKALVNLVRIWSKFCPSKSPALS